MQEVITCLPPFARVTLAEQVRFTADVPGDIAEVGVYKGGSAAIIAENRSSTSKALYLFDTFRGLPEVTERDRATHEGQVGHWLKHGDFGDVRCRDVQETLSGFGNIHFQVGLFEYSSTLLYHVEWSFVHLDGDLYETTAQGLKFFYPKMNPGGIILMDDCGREETPGVALAANEFMADKREKLEVVSGYQVRIVKL